MQLSVPLLALWAALLGAASATEGHSQVTPVQKVLEMLDQMLEKGKKEKHEEEVRYTAFKKWCTVTGNEKKRVIKAEGDRIVQLTAAIDKAQADVEQLDGEVAELQANIGGWEADASNATLIRKAEKADFDATDLDYTESIDALARAIQVLKARSADVPQSLAQVQKVASLSRLPGSAKRALASFVQASSSVEVAGPPEANAYEFQSQGIVEILEKLYVRFKEEREVLRKEEINRKHAYELLMQKLHDDIGYATDSSAAKEQMKGQRGQDGATAKGDLSETEQAKETDEAYLRDLEAECSQKAKDFESRQELRTQELEAIQKAIGIISSQEVAGAAQKYLPAALLQAHPKRSATALAQLRSTNAESRSPAQAKVAALLMERAAKAGSQLLATVAGRVGEDPFAKVKKMIKDLITKLMEEANAEADHKAWCDHELATNQQTRDQKSAEVSALDAEIDEQTAREAKLTQEIADLSDAIAEIDAAVAEATKTRADEKATNNVTITEAKMAQEAVTQAIRILKEFYSQAADATAMLQEAQSPAADAPFVFDEAYKGMQATSGGILGMLEVIQSDFARLEAETSASEEEAQRSFESFTTDSAKDKEVKEREARHKGFDQVRAARALKQAKKDLEATQAELDAALEYYDKLNPSCINSGHTYEERVARRKEEIVSLQEALRILSGEDV